MIACAQSELSMSGLRILLVEDNFLIASYIKRLLLRWGCEVVGPAPSLDEARRLADEPISGAILDINIIGGNSVPIAIALQEKGCPFFFITGYGSPKGLPDTLTEIKRLDKPIDEQVLESTMLHEIAAKQATM